MTDMTPPGTDPLAGAAGAAGAAAGPAVSADPAAAASASELAEDAGLAAERERLARQLRDTRLQLAMTQARLSALEQSATMRFGRMVANAAHRPWPRGAQLPMNLYKLWRERGIPKSGAANAATALASAQLTDLAGTGERFLSALTAPGVLSLADPGLTLAGVTGAGGVSGAAGGLVVTGALSALACATLAPDAVVHPLLPHDADVVLEGTGADLVLIEAAAMLPGEPWAYATDPAAADRGRRLARMVVMARSLGKPVVLVRNVPPSLMPGLSWLAPSCDAVVDGGFGVQLARFNPVGVTAARPTSPLYAGVRDPREAPAVRALLDALTGGSPAGGSPAGGSLAGGSPAGVSAPVQLAGARSWRGLPALYQEHGVFLTVSADQAREQLACGARVIGPLGSGVDADSVRAELEAARGADPLTLTEIRDVLRDVFATHATPARLSALARAAGLPAGLVGGRRIAVLATVTGAEQAAALAAALLGQRLRPAELVAATGGVAPADAAGVRDALGTLSDHGVRVVTTDAAATDGARPLARLASAPWVAPWDASAAAAPPDTYLLDLACARECAQADAVGFGTREYEFTHWLAEPTPGLARRDLLTPDGPPASDWGSHGLRLFTIIP
jgi:hypothetical protein